MKKVQDELSKNHHKTDQEIVTGFMPQLLNMDGKPHKLCLVDPVKSVSLISMETSMLYGKDH